MGFVPTSYNLRSLWVRRSATLLTVLGLGATVAVVAGILSLQQGFAHVFEQSGAEDVLVLLRPGASRETESTILKEQAEILVKELPEVARDGQGRPIATPEIYSAVRLEKSNGGEANVPIRGVTQMTFAIHGDDVRVTEGRGLEPGSDEVLVGRKLAERFRGCSVGSTITINVIPFRVVGILDHAGPFASEIWGDLDRMMAALGYGSYSRVIAKLLPDADVPALAARLEEDKRMNSRALTERVFLANQTGFLSGGIQVLVGFLALVMGVAAVFTAANTMQAALAARTSEVGILKALGFRPVPIFVAFLFEAVLLGLFGGIAGAILVLPLNGIETGTTNWDTFTEVAFAFRITPPVLVTAVVYAMILGLLGGAWPAWRAARMTPTEALRRG